MCLWGCDEAGIVDGRVNNLTWGQYGTVDLNCSYSGQAVQPPQINPTGEYISTSTKRDIYKVIYFYFVIAKDW